MRSRPAKAAAARHSKRRLPFIRMGNSFPDESAAVARHYLCCGRYRRYDADHGNLTRELHRKGIPAQIGILHSSRGFLCEGRQKT